MNENLQNPREIRGIELAYRYTLKQENGLWFVPSASGKGKYKVNLETQNCDCPPTTARITLATVGNH